MARLATWRVRVDAVGRVRVAALVVHHAVRCDGSPRERPVASLASAVDARVQRRGAKRLPHAMMGSLVSDRIAFPLVRCFAADLREMLWRTVLRHAAPSTPCAEPFAALFAMMRVRLSLLRSNPLHVSRVGPVPLSVPCAFSLALTLDALRTVPPVVPRVHTARRPRAWHPRAAKLPRHDAASYSPDGPMT